MQDSTRYTSYMIRIWQSQVQGDLSLPVSIKIRVENIQTGRNHQFDILEELFTYFESRIFLPDSEDSGS